MPNAVIVRLVRIAETRVYRPDVLLKAMQSAIIRLRTVIMKIIPLMSVALAVAPLFPYAAEGTPASGAGTAMLR